MTDLGKINKSLSKSLSYYEKKCDKLQLEIEQLKLELLLNSNGRKAVKCETSTLIDKLAAANATIIKLNDELSILKNRDFKGNNTRKLYDPYRILNIKLEDALKNKKSKSNQIIEFMENNPKSKLKDILDGAKVSSGTFYNFIFNNKNILIEKHPSNMRIKFYSLIKYK